MSGRAHYVKIGGDCDVSKIRVFLLILVLSPIIYFPTTYLLYFFAQRSFSNEVVSEIHSEWLDSGTIGGVSHTGAPQDFADARVLGQRSGYPNDSGLYVKQLVEKYTPLSDKSFYAVVERSHIRSLIESSDKSRFYKYPVRECGGVFCPFDPDLFTPLEDESVGEETLGSSCHSEREVTVRFLIKFHRYSGKCFRKNGTTPKRFVTSISVAAFNPLMSAVQFLPGRGGTDPHTGEPNSLFFEEVIFSFEFDEYLISNGSLPYGPE